MEANKQELAKIFLNNVYGEMVTSTDMIFDEPNLTYSDTDSVSLGTTNTK